MPVQFQLTGVPHDKGCEQDGGVREEQGSSDVVPCCVHRGLTLHEVILERPHVSNDTQEDHAQHCPC